MTGPLAAVVERVIDGDTMWIRLRLRTRANAPELARQGGPAAAAALSRAYPRGRAVTVTLHAADAYGRAVGSLLTPPL